MSPNKLTTLALASAAAIACHGAYDASAKTSAGKPTMARADTDTVAPARRPDTIARATEPAALHPTPPVLDSLIKGTLPVRGLYVFRFAANTRRMKKLLAIADSTEINAFVIDVKDEFGLNFNPTDPMLKKNAGTQVKATKLAALVDTIRAHGILPIARIIVFKDSVTARNNPQHTIRKADGSAWHDKKGQTWVNPYANAIWEYNFR
ncbi:MAG TPA: putative glycoside hydrolase, partial [Gemmatimonadaceae bacterium]